MFKGCYTALVTPFRDGKLDAEAFQSLVRWQIESGIHGLVPCGTTGESPTLDIAEHVEVIRLCVEAADGAVPVVAGVGSNDTRHAVALAQKASSAGANAALLVTPYYNKPNQDGLYAHFRAVHDGSDLPIVIYNIPGRCIVDMTPETMGRLAELPRIVAVKDATGDVSRVKAQAATCGPDFAQLSGDDSTAVAFAREGGVGAISVTSNLLPGPMSALWNAALAGRWDEAAAIDGQLMDLHKALFFDPSPGPAKFILAGEGRMRPDCRLPITPPSEATRAAIGAAWTRASA